MLANGESACLDRAANELCGAVDALSPFALAVVVDTDVSMAATKLIVVDKTATAERADGHGLGKHADGLFDEE